MNTNFERLAVTWVTVVIPAYNAEDTLARTLESVMRQTHAPLEIIVVDDGSVDGTAAIVRDAAARDRRITLIRQKNAGVAAARNAAMAAARGEWIAPVDHDDLWHPRKIELQVKAARDFGAAAGMVYSWSRRIDEHDRVIGDMGMPRITGNVAHDLLGSNFMRNASSSIFRRDLALAVGGFDPGLARAGAGGAEDLKLYLAIARITQVALAPYFLTGYRLVEHSMSQNADRMRRSVEMVLAEHEAVAADHPELFNLARMNYDLYAGGLALASRDWSAFARNVGSALRRRPIPAAIHLALNALWLARVSLRSPGKRRAFADLAEDEPMPVPLGDWFTRYQTRSVERAVARRPERTRLGAQQP